MEEITKPIKNSPGYWITNTGKVYDKHNKQIMTWYNKDGYERIKLYSIKHGKVVNRTIHLLIAEAFLKGGAYTNDQRQVNHKDGNKKNNNLSNLELVTGTENVNHAHNLGLYTYDLTCLLHNTETKSVKRFRSLRELSKYLNVSINYLKIRVPISKYFPIFGKYKVDISLKEYIKKIRELKGTKTIYVYRKLHKRMYECKSYSELGIAFGLSYITIGKRLNKEPNVIIDEAGFLISLNPITYKHNINIKKVKQERDNYYKHLISIDTRGPKQAP